MWGRVEEESIGSASLSHGLFATRSRDSLPQGIPCTASTYLLPNNWKDQRTFYLKINVYSREAVLLAQAESVSRFRRLEGETFTQSLMSSHFVPIHQWDQGVQLILYEQKMRIWKVSALSKSYREAQLSAVSHLLDIKGRRFL